MVSSKYEIRRQLKARRDALPAGQRATLSSRICAELLGFIGERYRRVALYAPIGSEVDTGPLFAGLRSRGIETLYPRCEAASRQLSFIKVDAVQTLRPGTFGVPEPSGDGVDRDSVDFVVLPGVAFDRRGGRIGYGAGYYDATLAGYDGATAGLAFEIQFVDELPTDAHDQTVDVVVTEAGVHGAGSEPGEVACPSWV